MKKSNSNVLLDYLEDMLKQEKEIPDNKEEQPECTDEIKRYDTESFVPDEIKGSDALVIACPLYMDGIPARFMSVMEDILNSSIDVSQKDCRVYLIINCGYYNPQVCKTAISLFRTWCEDCGFILSTAVAVGAGPFVKLFTISQGMLAPVGDSLNHLADDIKNLNCSGVMLTKPRIHQRIYIFLTHMGWRHVAKSNKLDMKSLKIKYTNT
ncbi:MAG: hypothetical protein K2G45_02190 [Lachnospiraceae bacterium]|nr:hypothetical protein [Lachnospiraceae bacterium]